MSFRARQNYGQVQLFADGKLIAELEPKTARKIGRAILRISGLAAEWANAEEVARDNAILLRAGFPVGLANHKTVIDQSVRLACWDRDLRKAMPGGVKSKEVFGTPTINQLPRGTKRGRSNGA